MMSDSLARSCGVQILFTVPVTAIMHDFWNEGEQEKQEIELVQFMKVRPSASCACIRFD